MAYTLLASADEKAPKGTALQLCLSPHLTPGLGLQGVEPHGTRCRNQRTVPVGEDGAQLPPGICDLERKNKGVWEGGQLHGLPEGHHMD